MNDSTELDIHRLIGPIRRRFRLVVGTIVTVVLLTALVVFSLTPLYTARALIFVDTSTKNLLEPQPTGVYSGTENARVDSEVEIMRSEAVLRRVVEENNLLADDEFNNQDSLKRQISGLLRLNSNAAAAEPGLQDVLEKLRRRVSITREGATFVIAVNVTSRDPQKAAQLANSIVNVYVGSQVEAKVQSALAARDVLQQRIDQAAAAVTESERLLEDYINDSLSAASVAGGSPAMDELRRQLVAARERRADAAGFVVTVNRDIQRGNWAGVGDALQSDVVRDLAEQRETAAAVLADSDPQRAESIRSELARLDSQLTQAARQGLEGLQQTVTRAEADEADLRQQIRTVALDGNLPPDVLTELYRLQQGSEIRRSQFQVLLSRLREVETQADLQLADSRLVSEAMPPFQPSFPRALLILAGSFVVAGLLGGGLAILRENYIGGIVTKGQAEDVLGVPFVVGVPLENGHQGKDGAPRSVADAMVDAPLSPFAEAIRRVRITLDQMRLRKRRNSSAVIQRGAVITVTSASTGEGKTTTSISLARAYAQSGAKTLLVDCDLRRPSIRTYLGITSTKGLSDYIANARSVSDGISKFVHVDAATGLRVITTDRKTEAAPTNLVDSQEFTNFIEASRKIFDIIILDAPPIGPVVDGLHLASLSDIVVLVIHWAKTPVDQVRTTMKSLEMANAAETEFCVVLNRIPKSEYPSEYADYYA
jgi:succinoglycan biosynthesis transport protein ExoP